jgi:hypothetical protein
MALYPYKFKLFFLVGICKMTKEPFLNSNIHQMLRDGRLNKKEQLSFCDEIQIPNIF